MSFSTLTGAISGLPVGLSNSITYTVTATNAIGSDTYSFNMQIKPPKAVWAKSSLGNARDICLDGMNNYYALIHSTTSSLVSNINDDGSVVIPGTSTVSDPVYGITYNTTTNIVKFNSNGLALWCKTLYLSGATNGRIQCDSSNNVYLAVTHNQGFGSIFNADINGDGSVMIPSIGSPTPIIIKFNSSGVAVWCKSFARLNVQSTSLNIIDDVLYAGYRTNNQSLSPVGGGGGGTQGPYDLNGDGNYILQSSLTNAFLIKYNTSGVALGYKMLESASGIVDIQDVDKDSNGNIFITGNTASTSGVNLNVSGTITIPATAGSNDAYLVKYNSSFEPLWCKSVRGNLADSSVKCKVDLENNVYISGSYNSTVNIDLGNGLSLPLTSSPDGYFVKYSSSGNTLWYKVYTGTDNPGTSTAVTVDSHNNVYVIGGYGNTSTFNITPTVTIGPVSGYDGYLIKYNSSGDYLWHRMVNSTIGTESARRLVIDNFDNIGLLININSGRGTSAQIDLNGDGSLIVQGSNGRVNFGVVKYSTY